MITSDDADMCDGDPGFDVAVTVKSSLRTMVQVWRGDRRLVDAVRAGALEVQGTETLRRSVPRWFTLSDFAVVPRPA